MPNLIIGLDIAKNIFQVYGTNYHGVAIIKRKLRRNSVLKFFATLEPALIGIEACHSAHYWARELTKLGHTVHLLPTQYVKPFVVGGKNDAAAIGMAVTRRDIHCVPIKSAEQQSLQSLHRIREEAIQERTAKSNQIRSLFSEEGIIFPIGLSSLKKGLLEIIEDGESVITPILRKLGRMYLEQLSCLQAWIGELNEMIDRYFKENDVCQRLATIPGVGPVIATAIVSRVGDPRLFKNGRHFAAWLGLTPRQYSSGGKTRLAGITKRGDGYIRKLLVQGAKAVIHHINRRHDNYGDWIKN
ncbi:IS110 family RNA-guided transposase [Photorhabdus akhurstii]|uniref:IS110 family transposase n=1 Tax=Photorhabdus akhurstii TaxID=171438 RepID=UPI001C6149FC